MKRHTKHAAPVQSSLPGRVEAVRARWPFDGTEAGHIMRQAAPLALVSVVNMGIVVTDTYMSATLGADTLAGVAIVSDIYTLLLFFLMGTIGGVAPLYAKAVKQADTDRLVRLRGAGLAVTLTGACLAALLFSKTPDVLQGVGIVPDLVDAGRGYAAVMALVFLPNAVAVFYRVRLTARQRPGPVLLIALAALPLNALLNWLFMHGTAGWSGFGATGLALSSLIVWTLVATGLAFLAKRADDGRLKSMVDGPAIVEILRVGLPIGVMTVAVVGLFLGGSIYVGTFSAAEAAAHAMVIRIAGMTHALSVGLNQATMVRVARQDCGVSRRKAIASALTIAMATGLSVCVVLSAAAAGLSVSANWLSADLRHAVALAVPLVAILALMECFGPVSAAADGVLRAQRDTRAAMLLFLTGNWLITVPAVLLLTQHVDLGVTGVWIGLSAGGVSGALLTCCRLPRHWRDGSPESGSAGVSSDSPVV